MAAATWEAATWEEGQTEGWGDEWDDLGLGDQATFLAGQAPAAQDLLAGDLPDDSTPTSQLVPWEPGMTVLSVDPGQYNTGVVVVREFTRARSEVLHDQAIRLLEALQLNTHAKRAPAQEHVADDIYAWMSDMIMKHGVTHIIVEKQYKLLALVRVEGILQGIASSFKNAAQGTETFQWAQVSPLMMHKHFGIINTGNHAENKRLAVSHANQQLFLRERKRFTSTEHPEQVIMPTGIDKVDDICDAYLHAVAFIETQKTQKIFMKYNIYEETIK
jgi:hypothetical protein